MKFPLSLVSDFLADRGFEVTQRPRNLNQTFDWVTIPKVDDGSAESNLLFVTDDPSETPPGSRLIILGEKASAPNKNAFHIPNAQGTTPASLASSLQLYLLSIYRWIEDMHHALAEHCSCTKLLKLSEPILKNYISVSDSTFSYIAHTPDIDPIEEASWHLVKYGRYSDEVIETVRDSGLSEFWSRSRPFKTFERNAINPKPSIEHVYHLNSQYAAHIVMVSGNQIFDIIVFRILHVEDVRKTALFLAISTDGILEPFFEFLVIRTGLNQESSQIIR